MPFNGSGVASAPSLPTTWNPAASGGTADPTDFNTLRDDIYACLSTALLKDGTQTVTADLPMAVHKLTGLSAGSGAGHSVRFEQVFPAGGSTLAALLRGYLSGCAISRASATTIGVAAGVAMDDTFVQMMPVASGTINCATTGADGLDAGSLANNTWYHVFAIAKTDGTVSRLASTSLSSPTYPTGYTLKRRLGSFKTNGSAQVIDFVQYGDKFRWVTMVTDVSTNGTGSAQTGTLGSVPTGLVVEWVGVASFGATSQVGTLAKLMVYTPGTTVVGWMAFSGTQGTGSTASDGGSYAQVFTNTSAQVTFITSNGGAGTVAVGLNTIGWNDTRGRDA